MLSVNTHPKEIKSGKKWKSRHQKENKYPRSKHIIEERQWFQRWQFKNVQIENLFSESASVKETAVDMFTTVFIGNADTKVINGRMVTPRGYRNV